jgi:hypothetical protein
LEYVTQQQTYQAKRFLVQMQDSPSTAGRDPNISAVAIPPSNAEPLGTASCSLPSALPDDSSAAPPAAVPYASLAPPTSLMDAPMDIPSASIADASISGPGQAIHPAEGVSSDWALGPSCAVSQPSSSGAPILNLDSELLRYAGEMDLDEESAAELRAALALSLEPGDVAMVSDLGEADNGVQPADVGEARDGERPSVVGEASDDVLAPPLSTEPESDGGIAGLSKNGATSADAGGDSPAATSSAMPPGPHEEPPASLDVAPLTEALCEKPCGAVVPSIEGASDANPTRTGLGGGLVEGLATCDVGPTSPTNPDVLGAAHDTGDSPKACASQGGAEPPSESTSEVCTAVVAADTVTSDVGSQSVAHDGTLQDAAGLASMVPAEVKSVTGDAGGLPGVGTPDESTSEASVRTVACTTTKMDVDSEGSGLSSDSRPNNGEPSDRAPPETVPEAPAPTSDAQVQADGFAAGPGRVACGEEPESIADLVAEGDGEGIVRQLVKDMITRVVDGAMSETDTEMEEPAGAGAAQPAFDLICC